MKATKVFYQRTYNTGDYSNIKVGIELECEEGERAIDVMEKAKAFVDSQNPNSEIEKELVRCKKVIDNPEIHSHTEYTKAVMYIDRHELEDSTSDDLPF